MTINKGILAIIFLMLVMGCEEKNIVTNKKSVDTINLSTNIEEQFKENDEEPEGQENYEEVDERGSAVIYDGDNTLYVYTDMKGELRLFGYAQPDTTSQKMILYSIFTNDVENNPFNCPFGAYYETNGLMNGRIQILSKNDPEFIKAEIFDIDVNDTISNIVYFEKSLIYIEND